MCSNPSGLVNWTKLPLDEIQKLKSVCPLPKVKVDWQASVIAAATGPTAFCCGPWPNAAATNPITANARNNFLTTIYCLPNFFLIQQQAESAEKATTARGEHAALSFAARSVE